MKDYEKLGLFYLGKEVDPATMKKTDAYYLYDSKDLTTHAVCVGMTGSGKTGLAIGLLEEAAIDQIPALVIDPKGDMANLLLQFPDLRAEDFKPWIPEGSGENIDQKAEKIAMEWKNGLADWDEDPDRIRLLKNSVDFSVYTPGSNRGKAMAFFTPPSRPSEPLMNDPEALAAYLSTSVSSLLSLSGIEEDPLTGPSSILLSNLYLDAWQKGEDLDFVGLVSAIQNPPMKKMGVLDMDTFYPKENRLRLIQKLNGLFASPVFAQYMQGEPMDIQKLLYTSQGRPRHSILSLAHLSEDARIFCVSTLLNRFLSWMRTQPGTSSLRAILYMDEIYGYFPPIANPPTKKPLLTLLKQARAYGVGLVLATQNPSDLDYKGLSNIGTWFIGRLQTEQDKSRLLEGLQKAGENPDSQKKLSDLLSSLPKRTFLVNNVHEENLSLLMTRWTLSYLAGPLTGSQLTRLKEEKNEGPSEDQKKFSEEAAEKMPLPPEPLKEKEGEASSLSSPLPAPVFKKVTPFYLPASQGDTYLPTLYAAVDILYEDSRAGVTCLKKEIWNTPVGKGLMPVQWEEKTGLAPDPADLIAQPSPGVHFSPIDPEMVTGVSMKNWEKDLVNTIYQKGGLTLLKIPGTDLLQSINESEEDFRTRAQIFLREERDQSREALQEKYRKKREALEAKISQQENRIDRERVQAERAKQDTLVNLGAAIFDSFMGRKRFKTTTITKASSTARSFSRQKEQSQDVERAQGILENYQEDLANLQAELEEAVRTLQEKYDPIFDQAAQVQVKPKKTNIRIQAFAFLWVPKSML